MSTPTLSNLLQGRRFGLVMSAGFFGFYGHLGFLKGLHRQGLQPSAYAGTSAGGLIAAHAAAGVTIEALEKLLLELNREHFWDPDPLGTLVGAFRGQAHGFTGLLKGDRFRSLLRSSLPVDTFEACPKPLVLAATNLTKARSQVFDAGELSGPVHATCAYPGLFRAVRMDDQLFWDGGIIDKAPLLALADSKAGRDLEAFVVHWLPSRAKELSGAFAYARGLGLGMLAARREHFALQLKVMEARSIPVYVVVSELPSVSPLRMARGAEAMEAARASTLRALAAPPVPFSGG